MSLLRRNLIANYAGSVWIGLMSLVFIPVYVKLMGVEAYGLVGFFVTLQGLFAILDLGLSTTLNREFARLSAMPGQERQQRNLLRTIESIHWLVALLNGTVVMLCSRPIAELWFRPEQLPVDVIQRAVATMGIVLLLQWPIGMYSGGLQGLQKQVLLNTINAVMAGIRGIGAVAVLWLVAPTLTVFFTWQIIVSALHTATIAIATWRSIGGTDRAAFDSSLLTSVWRFAAGMVGISLLAAALTQIDKLVVSKVLSLSTLGYYTIASAVAGSLYRIITPVFGALFPRFSQLAAADDETALTALYHRSCELLSVIVLPAAIFIAFFAREVLLLWTRDPVTAEQTHTILSILIVGTAANGIMNVPYAVQLAYGWTRLTLAFNIISVLILLPAVYLLARHYGAVGASVGWTVYNVTGAIVLPLLMHRRFLRGEQMRFYVRDVGAPLLAAVAAAAAARLLINGDLPTGLMIAAMFFAAAAVQLAAIAAIPHLRSQARLLVQHAAR